MKQVFFIAAMAASTLLSAQIKTPQPSPSAMVKQTVGLTEVEVEYARPAMRGRNIFGDLVPFGEKWRTGANANTTISFSDDVTMAGTTVPKGKYAIYTVPGQNEWQVMLYKTYDNWGLPQKWDDAMVLLSAKAPVKTLRNTQESFTVAVNEVTNDGAELQISWDKTLVAVPFTVPTQAKAIASIKAAMGGPSANDYFNAASYYFESNQDMKQASEWINKAVEMRPDAFWYHRRKSLIEAAMGDKKAAIASAKKSLELATKAGNKDYIKMNEDSLAEWGAK